LELASQARRPPPPAGMAHVGLAGVLYERGELDAALRHATLGIALCRQLAYPLPLLAGLATLAGIRQAQGDLAGALEAIAEAEHVQVSPAVVGLFNPVPARRARLLLAHGQVDAAARWAQDRGLGADDQPSYPRGREYLMVARVLLATDAPDQALRLLERLHAQAAAHGRMGCVIEVDAVQALAHAAAGDEPRGLAVLAEALALGAPEGYVRVFVDEGAPMAALLGSLMTASGTRGVPGGGVPPDYLRRLADAVHQELAPTMRPVRRGGAPMPGLVEPLSDRELEVLGLLAAGRPNQAIAEELVVALDTV
jgi:LuxR family maltose regulon positive regulatory protein